MALIQSLIAEQHLDAGDLGNPEGWANESHKLAEEAWVDPGFASGPPGSSRRAGGFWVIQLTASPGSKNASVCRTAR